MTEGQRIREFIRIAFDDSIPKTAEALGWSRTALYSYLRDERKPGYKVIDQLEAIGCRGEWIRKGSGEMFADNAAGKALRQRVVGGKEKLKGGGRVVVEYAAPPSTHRGVQQKGEQQPEIPLMLNPVAAGTPLIADDYIERQVDVAGLIVRDAASTIIVPVRGDSMIEAGIEDGALLVVDRGIQAQTGDVVVCSIDGELTCKEWFWSPGGYAVLYPRNARHRPIRAHTGRVQIYGVVRWVLKEVPRGDKRRRRA